LQCVLQCVLQYVLQCVLAEEETFDERELAIHQ